MASGLKTALRSLRRRPGDALINGVGLAVGLACCLTVALHVGAERSADTQHAGGDRVVRMGTEIVDAGGDVQRAPSVARPLAAVIAGDEAVEAATVVSAGDIRVERPTGMEVADVLFGTETFFDVLNGYAFVAGDARSALDEPRSVVLTEAAALRLTGRPRPVGETVEVQGDPYTVTGVLADGGRSHLAFDGVVSFATVEDQWDPTLWGNFDAHVYARLAPGAPASGVAERAQAQMEAVLSDGFAQSGMTATVRTQPLRSIYLSDEGWLTMPMHRSGSAALLSILTAIGLFVLAIAAVNFVNLSTARSAERAREVGVRKAVGAGRGGLVRQFLTEAVALALVSGVAALGLVALALPTYNGLTDAGLGLGDMFAPGALAAGLAVTVGVGLAAGLYPALALSGFRPVETLRGRFTAGRQGVRLRRGLVVAQFAISSALLVATLVVGAQLRHLRAQDPGFDRDRVLLVSTQNVPGADEPLLKEAFARVPGVEAVSLTYAPPTVAGWEAQTVTARGTSGASQSMETVIADPDYAEALGLHIVAGRDLSMDREADRETGVLLNEAAARGLGWTPEEAVGQGVITARRQEGVVVGVLADYAHHGVAALPRPQIYFDVPGQSQYAAVRVAPGADPEVGLQSVWEERMESFPFEVESLSAAVDAQYRAEERLARAFALFAGLAIWVAVLGLFGLAAYAVQRRTREIGVRKVLGATVAGLAARLSRDFAVPVVVGLVLAAPLTWWALGDWLSGFAVRIALTPLPFVVAGFVALAVALATVSLHTVRAASADPVRALRSE